MPAITLPPDQVPTVPLFRQDFPEFGDSQVYEDFPVGLWLDVGALMINKVRWPTTAGAVTGRSVWQVGIELFAAHNLSLERMNIKAAVRGAPPGWSRGSVASEGAGSVSVAYDTASGIEMDAGHWNLTNFGLRWLNMARMMGVGPMQVNGRMHSGLMANGPAWFGPNTGWLFGESW